MKLLLFLVMILAISLVSKGQDIYIEKIVVSSEYNSTYVLGYGNVFLYKIKYIDIKRIDLVFNELKMSGLFKEINWNLVQQEDGKSYQLEIKPDYKDNYENITIDDIVLEDFPEIKKEVFLQNLAKQNVSINSKWFNYSFFDLIRKIKIALQESSSSDLYKDSPDDPWVSIKESSSNKIKLIVYKNYPNISGLDDN